MCDSVIVADCRSHVRNGISTDYSSMHVKRMHTSCMLNPYLQSEFLRLDFSSALGFCSMTSSRRQTQYHLEAVVDQPLERG